MQKLALVGLSCLSLVAVCPVPSAEACSFPRPGTIFSRAVSPSDGATGVPTNVKLVVVYQTMGSPIADHLRLQASNGAEVDLQVTQPEKQSSASGLRQTSVLTPTKLLNANVQYQLLSDISQVPCIPNELLSTSGGSYPACLPVAGGADGGIRVGLDAGTPSFVVASFMTGSGPDQSAPAMSGAPTYRSYPYSCVGGGCCGPYEGYSVGFDWPSATDDLGVVMYELSHAGSGVLFPIGESASRISLGRIEGAFLCSGMIFPISMMDGYTSFLGEPGAYQVVAVDLAGNRSDPISVEVNINCEKIDAGAPDSPGDVSSDTAMDSGYGGGTGGSDGTGGVRGSGGASGVIGAGGIWSSGGTTGNSTVSGGFGGSSSIGSSTNSDTSSGCSCAVGRPKPGSEVLGLFLLLSTLVWCRIRARPFGWKRQTLGHGHRPASNSSTKR
jgi:hypothetical protein